MISFFSASLNLLSPPTRQWEIAYLNSSVDLDCRLTDPTVDIVLRHSFRNGPYVERLPDGNKVTKAGQVFTINNLLSSDGGFYECRFISQGRITGIKIQSVHVIPVNPGIKSVRT